MKTIFHPKNPILLRVLFFIVAFLVLFAFYLAVALAVPYTSDHASIFLEARSIIANNFLLKGWTLSTVSYFTTEIPFYILGILIFGNTDKVIYLVSAANYALLALLIISYSSITQAGRIVPARLIISTVFSLFIAYLVSTWGFLSPNHAVGFAYCLCSLYFLRAGAAPASKTRLLFSGIFLLLAFTGDTFTIYTWGIPVCLVLFFRSFAKEYRNVCIKLLVITLAAIAIAEGLLHLITASGGFTVPGLLIKYVDYSNIPQNLYLFFIGLFDLFSVNFFGKTVLSFDSGLNLVHLLGLVVFIAALVWAIKSFGRQSIIKQILTVTILLNLAAYLFSNMPVPDRSTVRYLMPALEFGIILITDYLSDINWYRAKPVLVILVCIVIGASAIPPMARSRTSLPVASLDTFLVDHHLVNGYGPYWLASITTVHTQGVVTIRPVISPNDDYIQPFYWLAENDWFTSPATFLAFDRNNSFNISSDTAIKTFGKPDNTYKVDNYTVLVWNKNITPELRSP
jgi:hypothetical protein